MNKRFVLVLVSILLIAGVVFAATQDFKQLSSSSRTARMQALHPLTDTVPETPTISEEELLTGLLTEEQRKAFDEQRTDVDAAFTRIAAQFRSSSGDTDV